MTHIGTSVTFDGELTSDEDLHFDGTLKGHLLVRDATLTIGDGATVEADVRARRVLVQGTAGSGTTLLALEFALTLADRGERALFLCFNRHLAAWLQEQAKHDPRAQCERAPKTAGI